MIETEFLETESQMEWMLFQLMEGLLDEPERSEVLQLIAENEEWASAWTLMQRARLHTDDSLVFNPELKRKMLKTIPLWKSTYVMWSGLAAACMALVVVARLFF